MNIDNQEVDKMEKEIKVIDLRNGIVTWYNEEGNQIKHRLSVREIREKQIWQESPAKKSWGKICNDFLEIDFI